jgi:4-hydroxybenzoate polyprenyltransferase
MTGPAPTAPTVPDARPGNWVDRLAPATLQPYLRLARFDRPIGAWLLLFPCWWGQALAELASRRTAPNAWYLLLFLLGAFVMRGAGCAYNDIVDRDIDRSVARTQGRPIPSGQISVPQAAAFMVGLCLVGLAVLLQFDAATVWLGIGSLTLVAVYPFMKRLTHWPQVVLGLTFKWGALVGWTAVRGTLEWPAVALYGGSVLWTIAYDTIYAHQDKEDDALVGVKSTALKLGVHTKPWLAGFSIATVILFEIAVALAHLGWPAMLAVAAVALHLTWQILTVDLDDPADCLAKFRSNRWIGWLLLIGIVAGQWLR